jgi:hypothetical protein
LTAVTGTFTATGQSATFVAPSALSGEFNVSLSGTWVGTVKLERSFDNASTWIVVSKPDLTDASFTAHASFSVKEPEPGVRYRLNCTAYTSGTVTYRLGH